MAYLAFDDGMTATLSPRLDTRPAPAIVEPARLSALEWSVVAFARNDRLTTLRDPGRMTSALRAVFRQHNPMLADERLEAVRRIAVLGWHHGYALPQSELERFVASGFSIDQYELLMTSIATARDAQRPAR